MSIHVFFCVPEMAGKGASEPLNYLPWCVCVCALVNIPNNNNNNIRKSLLLQRGYRGNPERI